MVKLPIDLSPAAQPPRPDAAYWIVGGLRGLGLEVARALATAGARHLVLTNRSGPGDEAESFLQECRDSGVNVVTARADVLRLQDLQDVVDDVAQKMPPIAGIVMTAAVLDDSLLANMDWERFHRVLEPKQQGAWNLHCVSEGMNLDWFVLFSSLLSLWGAAGSANYAAGNSFLDSLADHRRALGLPVSLFNWGPWSGTGMLSEQDEAARITWKTRGVRMIQPEEGLSIFMRNLAHNHPRFAVAGMDWPAFLDQFGTVPPFYRELGSGRPEESGSEEVEGDSAKRVVQKIGRIAAAVLGLDGPPDARQPLIELGMDSLLSVNLLNRLESALSRPVPVGLLLKGSSILSLAQGLFPELAIAGSEKAAGEGGSSERGSWLIFPKPNPHARVRLFCFPFAGGGSGTYRHWGDYLDSNVELIAIEPPGRQTRIEEQPFSDVEDYVADLIPELLPLLDRPYAFFGHCLGGLTAYVTARVLRNEHDTTPNHLFFSGSRPPHRLQQSGPFEEELFEFLSNHPDYHIFLDFHEQPDEVFVGMVELFNIPATREAFKEPRLRELILPTVRAEFQMAFGYRCRPEPPWETPITCFCGKQDLYVSREDAIAWSGYTTSAFQLYFRDGEHYLVVDDDRFQLEIIQRELRPYM
jgi:surfactin synthase thioesterase subunit/short-subunit dehydrogenase